jgi:hypothetical protein
MDSGMLGGIAGSILGVCGALFGTYCSIKNTAGPRERRFMIQNALIAWILIALFVALVLLLPNPYKWLIFIPYGTLLPIAITVCNRKQRQIKAEEAKIGEASQTNQTME